MLRNAPNVLQLSGVNALFVTKRTFCLGLCCIVSMVMQFQLTTANYCFSTAVWWMKWTSQLWSWMKRSGNSRHTSECREKLRRLSD